VPLLLYSLPAVSAFSFLSVHGWNAASASLF
jgi:hypothetical protein